jgi:hypothetical protein
MKWLRPFAGLALALFAASAHAELVGAVRYLPLRSDPYACTTGRAGDTYWNTGVNAVKVCDGTAWRTVNLPGSTAGADVLTASDLAVGAVQTAEILDGTIVNADIDAAAAIARSKLAEDALAVTHIPVANLRLSTFAVMGVSAANDGEFHLALASNAVTLDSDSADNTTDTSTFRFMVRLPENYVAAGDVSVRFHVALIESGAAATDNGSSIDLSCYEQGDGTVGSDIVSTAAQTFAATGTWYDKDFAITATDLVAGDILSCLATGAVIENNAGAETITMKTNPPALLADVKG